MSGRVLPFIRKKSARDWSREELAEFYRVEAALARAGMQVKSDRGLTDEGEPWFIFYRAEDDEVIVHFAMLSGRYLVSAPAYGADVIGDDFPSLVRSLLDRQPQPRLSPRANLLFHPSALLILLVGYALLKTAHSAQAAEKFSVAAAINPPRSPAGGPGGPLASNQEQKADLQPPLSAEQEARIFTAVALSGAVSELHSLPEVLTPSIGSGFVEITHTPAAATGTGDAILHADQAISFAWMIKSSPPGGLVTVADGHAVTGYAISAEQVATLGSSTLAGETTAADHHWATVAVAAPPIPSAGSAVLVESAAAAPHDLAVALVQGLHGVESVDFSAPIPGEFAALIAQGVHEKSSASSSQPQSIHALSQAVPSSAPLTQVPVPGSLPTGSVTTSSTDAGPTAPSASNDPTVTPPSLLTTALTDVREFVSDVVHPKVLVTSHSVIVYDADAIDHAAGSVTSLVFDFADGSSISLIGLSAEIHHLQA